MPKLKNGSIAFASVLAFLFILSPAAATLPTIPASGRVALGAFLNQTIADNLALAVMMLHEEGKIGFDDPVTKYLPEFERVRVMTSFNDADRTFESRPAARPITVRHLLTHTSGIGYSFADARLAKIDDGKKTVIA